MTDTNIVRYVVPSRDRTSIKDPNKSSFGAEGRNVRLTCLRTLRCLYWFTLFPLISSDWVGDLCEKS